MDDPRALEPRHTHAGSGAMPKRTPGGRQLLVASLVAAALVAAGVAWSAAKTPPAGPTQTTIVMTDYQFSPNHLTWHVGDRVTLTVVNRSQAQPPKPHEIMFGRGPMQKDGPFGPVQGDGFQTALLAGVAIDIQQGSDLTMLMAPGSQLSGVDPQSVLTPEARQMGMGEMMNQFMAVFSPGASLTLSFTVPDKPGDWEFGCFQQDGQHFLNGMHGTISILPAAGVGS